MEFAKPTKYIAKVSDKYFITENQRFLYIKFELITPNRISFVAGQYVSLKINEEGLRRSYSIGSTPDDNHGFHLLVELVGGGKGSEFLRQLQLGQEVDVMAPLGKFTISESRNNKLLFVAMGSGIVPISAMINDLLINQHETRQMRLHWGMKSEIDLFWMDNFGRLAEDHPNFVFDIVLSKPTEEWDLCTGHVQDCFKRDFPNRELSEWEAYVCGKQELVLDVCSNLELLGMKSENMYHEKYT